MAKKITDEQVADAIVGFCDGLQIKMLEKFYAGREEHNEDLRKLDIVAEIEAEMTDILVYQIIGNLQKR